MKPPPFAYVAPETVEETSALLAEYGDDARIIAGGQSLMPLLALRVVRPRVLVDIGRVSQLDGWRAKDRTLWLGANLRQQSLLGDRDLKKALPLCAEAAPQMGHPATRSRGTIVGSICHADPAAEPPVCMLVLDAELSVRSAAGERRVAAVEFFDGALSTSMSDDEFATHIHIRLPPERSSYAFCEISRRHGDFALVAVGCSVSFDPGDRIVAGKVAIGGVDQTPLSFDLDGLSGGSGDDEKMVEEVANSIAGRLDPGSDLHASSAYRRAMATMLIGQAIHAAVDRATRI